MLIPGGTPYDILDRLLSQTSPIHTTFPESDIRRDHSVILTTEEQSSAEELLIVLRELKIVSDYDQEIPQSQTTDNPMAPRGRATQPSRDTRKTSTTIVCDQKTPSISMILPVLMKLKKSLSVSDYDSNLVKAVKTAALSNLNTRYIDENLNLHLIVYTLLDPRYKDMLIDDDTKTEAINSIIASAIDIQLHSFSLYL